MRHVVRLLGQGGQEEIPQAVRVRDGNEGLRRPEIAAEDREEGEHVQRHQDHVLRIVDVRAHLVRRATLAEEGAEVDSEHVEGRDPGGQHPNRVERHVAGNVVRQVGREQDLVLGEEAGRDVRQPGDRHHTDPEDEVGTRYVLA